MDKLKKFDQETMDFIGEISVSDGAALRSATARWNDNIDISDYEPLHESPEIRIFRYSITPPSDDDLVKSPHLHYKMFIRTLSQEDMNQVLEQLLNKFGEAYAFKMDSICHVKTLRGATAAIYIWEVYFTMKTY